MPEENYDKQSANEVEKIRSILFGDQAAQFEERINAIDRALDALRNDNRKLRQALETELTQREQSDQNLEQMLNSLENKINAELSQRQKNSDEYMHGQDEFLNSIQNIVEQYRQSIQKKTAS